MIYVANVPENDLGPALDRSLSDPAGVRLRLDDLNLRALERSAEVAIVSAATEADLAEISDEDAREYLASLGV